jgi:hypothetical protein
MYSKKTSDLLEVTEKLDRAHLATFNNGITRTTIPSIPRFLDDFRLSFAETFVFLYLLVFFLSTEISILSFVILTSSSSFERVWFDGQEHIRVHVNKRYPDSFEIYLRRM